MYVSLGSILPAPPLRRALRDASGSLSSREPSSGGTSPSLVMISQSAALQRGKTMRGASTPAESPNE